MSFLFRISAVLGPSASVTLLISKTFFSFFFFFRSNFSFCFPSLNFFKLQFSYVFLFRKFYLNMLMFHPFLCISIILYFGFEVYTHSILKSEIKKESTTLLYKFIVFSLKKKKTIIWSTTNRNNLSYEET